MTHKHDHHHHQHQHDHHHSRPARTPKVKWAAWIVVALMLLAMAIYVVTNSEQFFPGNDGPVPADVAP